MVLVAVSIASRSRAKRQADSEHAAFALKVNIYIHTYVIWTLRERAVKRWADGARKALVVAVCDAYVRPRETRESEPGVHTHCK